MQRTLVVVIAVMLAGCGEVDLTGVYRVDSDVGSAPCSSLDTPRAERPFIQIEKQHLIGEFWGWSACTDAAATQCIPIGGFWGHAFERPIAGGWEGEEISSLPDGGMCTRSYERSTAVLHGNQLTIEVFLHEDTVALPAAQCDVNQVRALWDRLACADHHLIKATRL